MTKEELLAGIVEKLGRTNLDERTIKDFVENMYGVLPAESDKSVIDPLVGVLKSLSGNLSHGIKTALDDWKARNAQEKTKDEPLRETPPAAEPKELQALMGKLDALEAANKALGERLDAADKSRRAESYKTELLRRASCKVNTNPYLAGLAYAGIEPSEDGTVSDEAVDSFIKAYDEVCTKAGITPPSPVSTDGGSSKGEGNSYASWMKANHGSDFEDKK